MAAKKEISRMQQRRGLQVDLSGIVLNSGEIGWAADERRVYVGNRTTENAPVDENVEILTEYSTISASNIDKVFTVESLSVLGVDTTFATYDSTTDDTLIIDYKITQGAVKRTGVLRVISDGTLVSYTDDYIEVGGTTTVALKAIMSGTDIQVQYNATAATAILEYFTESI